MAKTTLDPETAQRMQQLFQGSLPPELLGGGMGPDIQPPLRPPEPTAPAAKPDALTPAPQSPSLDPATHTPTGEVKPGALANAAATHAATPQGPLPAFYGPHAGVRSGLANAFAGLAEFGGALNRHPGMGMEMVNRWADQNRAAAEFERNKPYTQQQADLARQQQEAQIKEIQSRTDLTDVEKQLRQNMIQNGGLSEQEAQQLSREIHGRLTQAWVNKSVPDWDAYVQNELSALPPAIQRRVQAHVGDIKQLQQTGKGYSLTMQDDLPKTVNVYGKELPRYVSQNGKQVDNPDLPPGAKEEFDQAMGAHETKRAEHRQDEATVAGYAAERQAAGFGHAQEMGGKEREFKATQDLNAANSEYQAIEDLVNKGSKGDAAADTAVLIRSLGINLPPGVHRINDTELNQLVETGSLPERWAGELKHFANGERFSDKIRQEMLGVAQTNRDNKVRNAQNDIQAARSIYGGNNPPASRPGAAPAGGSSRPPLASFEK